MRMLKPRPLAGGLSGPAAQATAPVAAPATPARRGRALALVAAAPAQQPLAAPAPRAAAAPAAVLQHTHSFLALLAQSMARATANAAALPMIVPLSGRAETDAELLELNGAVLERLLQLQQEWWGAWMAWTEEFGQLRRADTLSEHLEQQYNIGAQFGALLKAQASDLVDLQDTVQVDYGYWAARKLRGPAG